MKADAIRILQRALHVLELPEGDMGSSDGVGHASPAYKIGWATAAVKDALKELGANP